MKFFMPLDGGTNRADLTETTTSKSITITLEVVSDSPMDSYTDIHTTGWEKDHGLISHCMCLVFLSFVCTHHISQQHIGHCEILTLLLWTLKVENLAQLIET